MAAERKTLAERVIAKCVESGDCLIWKGAWASEGTTPSIHYQGKTVNVRTALWTEMGHRVTKGHAILPKCGEDHCVSPLHLESRNYRRIPKSAVAKATITKVMRERSKLSDELVAEIRASEEPLKTWADRLGMSIPAMSDVRNYRRWAPTNNPFSGLMK